MLGESSESIDEYLDWTYVHIAQSSITQDLDKESY